jgi:hypothetical protein
MLKPPPDRALLYLNVQLDEFKYFDWLVINKAPPLLSALFESKIQLGEFS